MGLWGSQLFLFSDDVTGAPIHKVELAPGIALPPVGLDLQEFLFRIFHFNDLHGHLMRFTQDSEEADLAACGMENSICPSGVSGKTHNRCPGAVSRG